jgi:hypothetical protein
MGRLNRGKDNYESSVEGEGTRGDKILKEEGDGTREQ